MQWVMEDWLSTRVLLQLPVFDALPLRAASQSLRTLSELAAAESLAGLRAQQLPSPDSSVHWLRGLAQAHAPPRLVCVGGYNSNWNRHEPVSQDGDAMGCETSCESTCSFQGNDTVSMQMRSMLPAMLYPRADLAVASGWECSTVYAVGGRAGEERHASVESLDLVRWQLYGEGWQERPAMMQGRSGLVVGLLGSHLVAAGGRGQGGVLRDVEVCDLRVADNFQALPPLQEPREYPCSAIVNSEFWVMAGGETGRSNTVEIFDVGLEMWRPGPELRVKRYGASAVWHDGRIFVVGGSHNFRGKQFTTIEWLDPREGTWTCHDVQAPDGPGYRSSLWGSGVVAHGSALWICGGAFRESEESLSTVYRLDLRTLRVDTLDKALGSLPGCGRLQVARWCGGACIV